MNSYLIGLLIYVFIVVVLGAATETYLKKKRKLK